MSLPELSSLFGHRISYFLTSFWMNVFSLQPQFKKYALYERGMRPLSYRSILASLKMFCDWAKTEELAELDESMVREFLYSGRDQRLWAARTFRNHRQYLKSFFDWCVKRDYLTKNPVEKIGKPKLPKKILRCLTKEEAMTVINSVRWCKWRYTIEPIRNETIICMFITTGLRLQELLNLQTTDVNLPNAEITVRQGKGLRDRIVPIHPQLIPILRAYLAARKQGMPSQWFFTGVRSDMKMLGKDVRNICRKVSLKTGIKFTPHMLRHTFGRLSVEADLGIYKIKEIMGHSSISTTENYLSVSTQSVKESFNEVSLI